jgi:hypothetical protein
MSFRILFAAVTLTVTLVSPVPPLRSHGYRSKLESSSLPESTMQQPGCGG